MTDGHLAEVQELCVYNTAGTIVLRSRRVDVDSLSVQDLKPMIRKSMGLMLPQEDTHQFCNGQISLLFEGRSLEDTEELDPLWPSTGLFELQVVARSMKVVSEMYLEAHLGQGWREEFRLNVTESGDVMMLPMAIDHVLVRSEMVPAFVATLISPSIHMKLHGHFHCKACNKMLRGFMGLKAHLDSQVHAKRIAMLKDYYD
mmetsp:Transcript_48443/g.85397  ORF Transcript_48443/g.85397 Transcript_48443/m.85397 type:complete len:201 (-) Transcript_48443:108-710(-)